MLKKIYYVGRFGFPDTAPGIRVFNVSKILKSLGYSVRFISTMGTRYGQEQEAIFENNRYTFVNICKNKNKFMRTLSNLKELLTSVRTLNYIKGECLVEKPYAIILYNDLYPLTKKLLEYCKKNNIRLFADVTEWYEKRKYKKLGDFIIPFWTDKRIRKLDKNLDGIIAISSYLADYYKSHGCKNIICVPPLFNVEQNLIVKRHIYGERQTVNLVYAGSPGSKDILVPVFQALELINSDSIKIRLDLVGITETQLSKMWKSTDFRNIGIFAHGRLSHQETIVIVKNADFGILFRENKRYAKAGYSTKFVECMINGVAMLCNKIGGADADIIHFSNGIILKQCITEELYNNLVMLINSNQITEMKQNAYIYAQTKYNINSYTEELKKLLENIYEI